MKTTIIGVLLLICSTSLNAQISGTVFRDFNGNGVKDNSATFNEPFVQGVTVKATLSGGTFFTTTTNTSGTYSFSVAQVPVGTKVRIEFSGLALGDYSSSTGSGNGSNVQFTTAPGSSVNFAVNAPDDYWNNATMPLPPLMLVNSRRGTTNSFFKDQYTILQINNNTTGPSNPANASIVTADTTIRPAFHFQTGSLFGLTVQSKQERFFTSAILKRASGFGPQGAGGIYMIGKSGASWTFTGSFTLQGVTPSNGGAALDFGSVTRVTSPATDDNYISDNDVYTLPTTGSDARDIDAFVKASTMSYGEIDADPLSDKIYMINLFQKRLIVFNASATTAGLNGASAATLAPFASAYNITSLPGCPAPTGAGNNIRPFAVKIYKGKGYIGVVSDAMSTQNLADLKGYILQFDPANIAAGFTTVITINFNSYVSSYWHPWVTTWAQAGGTSTSGPVQYAQPIISGIEFNENGSMDIAIRDRWGDQGATYEYFPIPGATKNQQTAVMGDLLHACSNGTGWALEGTPGSCDQPAGNTNSNTATNNFGYGFSYGNTGKEWYADKSGDNEPESNEGGLTKLMGTGIIVSSVYDPIASGETAGSKYWSTHGVQWNNVTTGAKDHIARIQGVNSNSIDKANGLGDLEFLAQLQPIQVGNRIWLDANSDGIQDPEETDAGVPTGTIVTLRSPGVDGIYGNGDDQTWITTTDANGNYYFSSLSSSDNRKPASWTGVGNTLLPGYNYRIEVIIPNNNSLTSTDAGGPAGDNIDNDAAAIGSAAIVNFNTSNTNHNFDIGIVPIPLPLTLVSFTAQLNAENVVDLKWETVTEINVSHFEIEKSTDGISFSKAGIVSAKGNTEDITRYSMKDMVNGNQSSLFYYRLRSVDIDGKSELSKIRIIRINKQSEKNITILTYPNPVGNEVRITIPPTWQNKKVVYEIFNASGQTIKRVETSSSSQTETMNVSSLSPGFYLVRVKFNGQIAQQKIVKQ
jgi:Secretion system C-terminal sorting domain/SdrD B-like domain